MGDGQTPPPDSLVQLVAESQGLESVAPSDLPAFGTYWLVLPSGVTAPLPCPPYDQILPIYQIADGQFLVDQTGGQVVSNSRRRLRQMATLNSDTAMADAVGAVTESIVALIDQIQTEDDNRQLRTMALSLGVDVPSLGGDGGGTGDGGYSPEYTGGGTPIDTNALYLQITNHSGGWIHLNLCNATNQVYAIWTTTNLATPGADWQVETELFPIDDQTNVMPFAVPNLDPLNLFIRAEDWTGKDSNGDGVPDWWLWKYFGTTGLSDTNLGATGNYTLGFDYSYGIDPNAIEFTPQFPPTYVQSSLVSGTLNVVSGIPSYLAVLVNDTNFSTADWHPFSTNVLLNLNAGNGIYDVWLGVRGRPADAVQTWIRTRFTLYDVPLTLTITQPTTPVVSQPMIQLQGASLKSLASLTFDVSNTVGVVSNQAGYVTGRFYDTNLAVFTTNYFQCDDVALGSGLNLITLHATDLAGNLITTNFSFTLNDSSNANPPVLSVVWPPDGTYICDNNFTLQAQVDDATAKINATIVDENGNTNTVPAVVERNGKVWANKLPLGTGANTLTITATNAAGSTSAASVTLYQSGVMVTVDPLTQLNQPSVTVTGTISDPSYDVSVNGVSAYYLDAVGDWEADGVPVSPSGVAVLDVEVGGSGGGNRMASVARSGMFQANDSSSSTSGGSIQFVVPQPVTVSLMSYFNESHCYFYDYIGCGWFVGGGANGHYNNLTQWHYLYGGTKSNARYGNNSDNNNYDQRDTVNISASENGVAYLSSGAPFTPPWEQAAGPVLQVDNDCGYSIVTGPRVTQARVMIAPAGQKPAAGTSFYLVRACAAELSNPGPYNFFYGDVPLPPEWLQINGQTLVSSGLTNDNGAGWGETVVSGPAGKNVEVTPVATQVHYHQDYTFDVKAFELNLLAVDNNRDGSLSLDDSDATAPARPFRFWINNFQESGDVLSDGKDSIPGYGSPNYARSQVNGRSDLVNFFPVALCVSNILQWLSPTNGYEYHLSQTNSAVKFVYTGLTPTNAFDYLADVTATDGYGVHTNEAPQSADTLPVLPSNATGTILDTNWLTMVQNNGGVGIILMEGAAATTQPLMLEIWHKDEYGVLQKLGGVPLYLSIDDVEKMYRWVNLRNVVGATETRATDTSEPANNPDAENLKGNFVFVHGYSVSEQSAYGWNAEIFKRLWQSHSHTKFYAVDWDGNEGQIAGWVPFAGGSTPDYYTNVANAFLTASNLALVVNALPGQTCIAGHSLGNMVVSSAIADWNLNAGTYLMIDAAVAMEAYNASTSDNLNLVPPPYWINYSNRVWASKWYQLFDSSDARSSLTWSNRFGNFPNAYNYYSSTEDVLENADGTMHNSFANEYAWVNQEMRKGSFLMSLVANGEAGWGLNSSYDVSINGILQHLPPERVATNSPSRWQTNSFFGSFYDAALYGANGSVEAANLNVRAQVLGDGIPALSNAAGANYMDKFGQKIDRNMPGFETGWPASRLADDQLNNRWLHSDIIKVAYPFTHKAFEQIVTDGGLK